MAHTATMPEFKTDHAREFYANNPTVAELCAILGPNWGICRATPKNLERYGRCITRKEYDKASKLALQLRASPDNKLA